MIHTCHRRTDRQTDGRYGRAKHKLMLHAVARAAKTVQMIARLCTTVQ